MKKIIKLTESELVKIVNKVILEQKVDEGIFDGIKNAYRGLKGMKRGFGTDYFQNMSRLENLIKKLKNLDVPNEKVMNELEKLKTKVSSLGMPQARKDALIALIDNSLYHFKKYSNVNDQILTQIKTLNLDSWK
jgi:UTP-glucose-1-phosphate uridylyltransferase